MKKILIYLLAAYTFLGFFIVPLILKTQLINAVSEQTNAKLSCETVSFNPFIFKLSLENLILENHDDQKLLSFKNLSIDLEFYSLFRGAIHLKELLLDDPRVYIEYNADKSINLLNILKPSESKTDEAGKGETVIPRIIVDDFKIVDGLVGYKDHTLKKEFDFSFKHIGFTLKGIDTKELNTSDAQLRFHTSLADGGFFDFKTQVKSYEPFIAKGSINFEASQLYTEWKYLQENLNLEVADGKISLNADYYLNLDDLNSTKISNLNLAFNKLRIKPKNQHKDVLNLEYGSIHNATILPLQQDVKVQELCINSLNVKVKRKKDEKIDWMEFIQTNFNNASTTKNENSKPSKPWHVVVESVKLEKIAVEIQDKAILPNVTTKLNDFNFYAHNATLMGQEPMTYEMNLLLNDRLRCNANGVLVHKLLDLQTQMECKGFDIVHYKPYLDKLAKENLKTYDVDLQQAELGFNANVKIKSVGKEIAINLQKTDVFLKSLQVSKKSTHEALVNLPNLDILGIKFSSVKKDLEVSELALSSLAIKAQRYQNNTINFDGLVEAKKSKKSKKKEKPFSVKLNHLALKNVAVDFKDKVLSPSVTSRIDKINLDAYNIDLKKNTWLKYKLSMRINKKGKLFSQGKIRHTPLAQKGSLELKKISLKELTPYVQEFAFVNIDDGEISLNTKTSYAQSKNKPDVILNGSFNLSNFYAVDSRDKSALVGFSKVDLNTFTLELSPNRFYADEVDIGSFYVDVLIDKKKKLNFAKVMKSYDDNASKAKSTSITQETNSSTEPNFPVKIAKVNISEGNIKFADLSIPIEFRTLIHNFNGSIYPISNIPGETATVDISGEVDDYGSTKLAGNLNTSNPKEYTDLSFNFKNLEMNSFSGYSASFAGHEIDGGKLYLDLGYKINDSQLHGQNSIIIKQMKLGREIEDENVTKLPLGFVIALLEDSDGVIDIDMPVEGNLDEPDFKYGALIWRTLGGLITKAITSPFKFLGSMMGLDGDSLEYVEYEPGSAIILPTEREKLDNIVKMMLKRPKIALALTPIYDIEVDKKAMQLNKLIDIVVERSGIKNKKDHKSAMTIDMLEDIYEDLKDDDALDKLEEKLEKQYPKKDEKYERAYLRAVADLDIALQVVTQEELEQLANERVLVSIKYLTKVKGLDPQRIIKLELKAINNSEDNFVRMPLEIKVK